MGLFDDLSKNMTEAMKKAEQERHSGGVGDVASLSQEDRSRAFETAAGQLTEEFTSEIEGILRDLLLPGEEVIYKVRSSPTGDRSQLLLTDQNVIIVSEGLFGGQGQVPKEVLYG